ncbi:MAG: hypothetical protein EBR30_07855 [Cytophagia bacterium]|nr:hypothetical protein [Cytophagia bacterium]
MNWTNLIIGFFFLLFGLIGMSAKSDKKDGVSYSGIKIIYSSYGLIAVGILLIIWSLFSE